MLRLFLNDEQEKPIDSQIAAVLKSMDDAGVDSEKYPALLRHLERLHELKKKNTLPPVSRDTIALVVGNFLIALIIVAYEQKHVMTTKVPIPFNRTGKT
jgi:hypothetical protein